MTESYFYPELKERDFVIIAKLMESNKDYLTRKECPYGSKTKDILQGVSKHQDYDKGGIELNTEVPEATAIIAQINSLASELQDYGRIIRTSDDATPSDRNTYFRLSVTLMEKLLDLKEKAAKISEYELFVATVLDLMDKVLDTNQRNVVMDRLAKFAAGNSPDGTGE